MYQMQTSPLPYFIAMLNPIIALLGQFEPQAIQEIYERTGIDFPLGVSFLITYTFIALGCLFLSIKKLRPNMGIRTLIRKA